MADKGRSLAQAVATSVILLVAVVVCYLLGPDAFFVLAAAAISLALLELFDAVHTKGRQPESVYGLTCCLALLITAYLRDTGWFLGALAAAPAGCLLFALRSGDSERVVDGAAWTVLGVVWIGGGGAGAVSILALPSGGLRLLIGFLLVAAAFDVAAYFMGTGLGRHPMASRISPAKTWEGLAGGVAGSLVVAALLLPAWTRLDLAQALGLGVIVAFLAPVGDLVESRVKRELGIKDSGRLLPGHGGMLDRLDAILFCAPAVFLYLHLILS